VQHDIPKDVATSSSESYSLLMATADDADWSSEHIRVPNRKTYRTCQELVERHYRMTVMTLWESYPEARHLSRLRVLLRVDILNVGVRFLTLETPLFGKGEWLGDEGMTHSHWVVLEDHESAGERTGVFVQVDAGN
jgi:hypothetical protein